MKPFFLDRVEGLLKRWGVLSPYDRDDVLNATIEDSFRYYEITVAELREETERKHRGNEQLRNVLRLAKERIRKVK